MENVGVGIGIAIGIGFYFGKKKRVKARKRRNNRRRLDSMLSDSTHGGNTLNLAHQLEALTRLESRVTILGYLQRGGTPSAID